MQMSGTLAMVAGLIISLIQSAKTPLNPSFTGATDPVKAQDLQYIVDAIRCAGGGVPPGTYISSLANRRIVHVPSETTQGTPGSEFPAKNHPLPYGGGTAGIFFTANQDIMSLNSVKLHGGYALHEEVIAELSISYVCSCCSALSSDYGSTQGAVERLSTCSPNTPRSKRLLCNRFAIGDAMRTAFAYAGPSRLVDTIYLSADEAGGDGMMSTARDESIAGASLLATMLNGPVGELADTIIHKPIDRPTSFNASCSAAPGQGHGLQYSHAFHAHGGPFTGATCVFSTRVEWMKRREVGTGYVRNSDLDIEDLETIECGLTVFPGLIRFWAKPWGCLAAEMGGMLLLLGIILVWLIGRVPDDDADDPNRRREGIWVLSLSWFDDAIKNERPQSAMKTIIVAWQTVTQFSVVAENVYPRRYAAFISIISFAALDVGSLLSYPCGVKVDFFHQLLLVTIGPMYVLLMMSGVYLWATRCYMTCRHALRAVRCRLVSIAFLALFFVYATITSMIVQTFACDLGENGVRHLRVDVNLICFTQRHIVYAVYASAMVVIYPIGVPVLFAVWHTRNELETEGTEESVDDRTPGWNIDAVCMPSGVFHDITECGRRVLFAASSALGKPGGRLQVTVVLLNTFLPLIFESLHYFESKLDTILYRWGNSIVLSSYFVALLNKTEVSPDDMLAVIVMCDVLILANLLMVAAVLMRSLLVLKSLVRHIHPAFV